MNQKAKKYIPLFVSLLFFLALLAVIYTISLKKTGGSFNYVLDDPYIHMSIAKNLVLHGSLGVNPYGFCSSSSSPLWTLILATGFYFFGFNIYIPLILNTLCASFLIITVFYVLKKQGLTSIEIFASLLILIIALPLVPMVFTGMEHVLHALLTIIFIYFSAEYLAKLHSGTGTKPPVLLIILALLLTASRYEGVFTVIIIATLILIKRKFFYGVLILIVGAIPSILIGWVSIANGWGFIPNSILLKGNLLITNNTFDFLRKLFYVGYQQLAEAPHLVILFLTSGIIFIYQYKKTRNFWESGQLLLFVFIVTLMLHLQFASTGWFYRYEAYTVAAGIFVIAFNCFGLFNQLKQRFYSGENLLLRISFIILLLVFLAPLIHRGVESLNRTPFGMKNIQEQQIQVTKFLAKYYYGKPVAMNDIGAVNYYSNINTVDLAGLTNYEIALARKNHNFNTKTINEVLVRNNVSIGVLYPNWFQGNEALPFNWSRAGEWIISNNFTCSESKIGFFASDRTAYLELIKNLRDFSRYLPADVEQSGEYCK